MRIETDNLGELELAVMKRLWADGPCDVKTVHKRIGEERGITYNTVQSAMKRLYDKGLLDRSKQSYAYVYIPVVDRRTLTEHRVSEVVDELTGVETLDRLERLVAARKAQRDDE